MADPPKPRYRLELTVDASTLDDLLTALVAQGRDWLAEYRIHERPPNHGCWGGGGSSGHYRLTDRGGPTEEQYRAELLAWAADAKD